MLLLNPNYVTIGTACGNRKCAAARSSEQPTTTESVRPPRACFQSVVIPTENVVRFSCGPTIRQRAPIDSFPDQPQIGLVNWSTFKESCEPAVV